MKYRGWLIKIEYKYTSGKCDFQYYPPDNEPGYIASYCTLEQVKSYIDDRIDG